MFEFFSWLFVAFGQSMFLLGIFGCGRTWCLPWEASILWLTFLSLVTAGVCFWFTWNCCLCDCYTVGIAHSQIPWLTSNSLDWKQRLLATSARHPGTIELWCSCGRHRFESVLIPLPLSRIVSINKTWNNPKSYVCVCDTLNMMYDWHSNICIVERTFAILYCICSC